MYTVPVIKAKIGSYVSYSGKMRFDHTAKCFSVMPSDIPVEVKQQRDLTSKRTNSVSDYVVQNEEDFIFPGVVAVVKGIVFNSIQSFEDGQEFGLITLTDEQFKFFVDGQGRLSGISDSILRNESLQDNFLDIQFFEDRGLEGNRQMFVDINKNASKSTQAININFDKREAKSLFTKATLDSMPDIKRLVDYEKTSAGGKSTFVWTINQFANFLVYFTGLTAKQMEEALNNKESMDLFIEDVQAFFAVLKQNSQFNAIVEQKISPSENRETGILGTAIMLETLGVVGKNIMDNFLESGKVDWNSVDFSIIDFAKDASHWQKRMVTEEMAIIKNTNARTKSALYILSKLRFAPSEALLDSNLG